MINKLLSSTPKFHFESKPSEQQVLDLIKSKIKGALLTDNFNLDWYSTDGSIYTIKPLAIFFPKDVYDIQTVLYILNEAAFAGTTIPLIARGRGTDQGGGPLGRGIIVDFSETLNQILEITDSYVRVQPGARYGELQKMLKERGKYLPPYPASVELATVGGAVANNSAGEKTLKYGSTRNYVLALKVLLANGDIIETTPIDHRLLHLKRNLKGFEGKIYNHLSHLISENEDTIKESKPHVSKNSAGYALWEVDKKGGFDLSQIIVGSQGTLAIVVEATLKIADFPKETDLLVGYFDDLKKAGDAVMELRHLNPSALEVADKNLINLVNKKDPKQLKGLLPKQLPEIILLCEFDNPDKHVRSKKARFAKTIMNHHAYEVVETKDTEEQAKLWKLRRSAAMVMWTVDSKEKALPIIEDGTVHASLLAEFFRRVYELFKKHNLTLAVWGHAGDADLHMQPFLDLGKKEHREKVYKVMDDFYKIISDLGGTTCGEHNDGITRTPYLKDIYGAEMVELFEKVKDIFDPLGILNPKKKVGLTKEEAKEMMRHEYSMEKLVKNREDINR